MEIIGTIDVKEVERLFDRLIANSTRLSPAMVEIGEMLLDSVQENFDREGRPKWDDLKPGTKKQRRKKGKWPGKILQQSGNLANSVSYDLIGDNIVVGSEEEYAGIQNDGGTINHPGTADGFGMGIPIGPHSIDIPQRKFLDIMPEDEKSAVNILFKHLLKGVKSV